MWPFGLRWGARPFPASGLFRRSAMPLFTGATRPDPKQPLYRVSGPACWRRGQCSQRRERRNGRNWRRRQGCRGAGRRVSGAGGVSRVCGGISGAVRYRGGFCGRSVGGVVSGGGGSGCRIVGGVLFSLAGVRGGFAGSGAGFGVAVWECGGSQFPPNDAAASVHSSGGRILESYLGMGNYQFARCPQRVFRRRR